MLDASERGLTDVFALKGDLHPVEFTLVLVSDGLVVESRG